MVSQRRISLGQTQQLSAPGSRMRNTKSTGRIYQVRDRQNDLGALLCEGRLTRQGTELVRQIEAIIARGYRHIGVVTHQPMIAHLRHLPIILDHFYNEHGTPQFRGCDSVIVAGTPMLPVDRLQRMASMIFFERDQPFNTRWSVRAVPYRGQPGSAATPGFWQDADLHAILRQTREAEIERAAYRAQPFTHPVDIWLLTSIPTELPVTNLITSSDLLKQAQRRAKQR